MILLTIIFLELAQAPAIWVLLGVDDMIRLGKVDLVIISNDLTLGLSLQTHLDNISRLVVEETVRISQP